LRAYRAWFRPDPVALSLGASVASTAAVQGLGFGRAIALTWFMPPEQYGLFGVALLVINLLLPLAALGLHEGIARYVPQHEVRGSLPRFLVRIGAAIIGTSLLLMALLAVLAAGVGPALFAARDVVEPSVADGTPAALTRAVAACVVSLAAYHGLVGVLRGLRMFRASSLMEVAGAVTTTALLLTLAGLGGADAATLVLGYAASNIGLVLLFSPGMWLAVRGPAQAPVAIVGSPPAGRAVFGSVLKYSVWSACGATVWHLLFYYPAWQVLHIGGEEPVAVFHATRMLTQVLLLVAVMISGVIAASVNHLWEADRRGHALAAYGVLTRSAGALLLAAACALAMAWPVVLRLLPTSYADGGRIFPPLTLFFFLLSTARLSNVGCQLIERPRTAFGAWTAGLAACVAAMTFGGGWFASAAAPTAEDVLALAAWSSAAGAAVALMVMLTALHVRGVPLDGRLAFMSLASAAVALSPFAAGVLLVALVAAAAVPGGLLSRQDREVLRRLLFDRGTTAGDKGR
jgi:O-antigen/teichoic acid export membrane protein